MGMKYPTSHIRLRRIDDDDNHLALTLSSPRHGDVRVKLEQAWQDEETGRLVWWGLPVPLSEGVVEDNA